jgi:hypothetical protein
MLHILLATPAVSKIQIVEQKEQLIPQVQNARNNCLMEAAEQS